MNPEAQQLADELPYRVVLALEAHLTTSVEKFERAELPLNWSEVADLVRNKFRNNKSKFLGALLCGEQLRKLYEHLRTEHSTSVKLMRVSEKFKTFSEAKALATVCVTRIQIWVAREEDEGCRSQLRKAMKIFDGVLKNQVGRTEMDETVEWLSPVLSKCIGADAIRNFPDVHKEFVADFRRLYNRFGYVFPNPPPIAAEVICETVRLPTSSASEHILSASPAGSSCRSLSNPVLFGTSSQSASESTPSPTFPVEDEDREAVSVSPTVRRNLLPNNRMETGITTRSQDQNFLTCSTQTDIPLTLNLADESTDDRESISDEIQKGHPEVAECPDSISSRLTKGKKRKQTVQNPTASPKKCKGCFEKTRETRSLTATLRKQEKEIANSARKSKDFETRLANFKETNSMQVLLNQSQKTQIKDLETKNKRLETELEETRNKCVDLESQMAECSADQLGARSSETDNQHAKTVAALESKNQQFEAELEEMRNKCVDFESHMAECSAEQLKAGLLEKDSQHAEIVAGLEGENQRLETEMEELKNRCADLETRIESCSCEKLELRLLELKNEHAKKVTDLETKNQRLEAESEESRNKCAEFEAHMESCSSEQLKATISEMDREHDEIVAALRKDLAEKDEELVRQGQEARKENLKLRKHFEGIAADLYKTLLGLEQGHGDVEWNK